MLTVERSVPDGLVLILGMRVQRNHYIFIESSFALIVPEFTGILVYIYLSLSHSHWINGKLNGSKLFLVSVIELEIHIMKTAYPLLFGGLFIATV